MISLVHPGCNANVRAVAKAFADEKKLATLFTSICGVSGSSRFRSYPVPRDLISTYPFRELGRILSHKLRLSGLVKHEHGLFSVDRVWGEIDDWASRHFLKETQLVYAYEDAAYYSFREAKKRGWKTIYDLPIGYWKAAQEIYQEERDLFPEFAPLMQGLQDSNEKYERKEEELRLADRVHVCSGFVKSTLLRYDYPEEKMRTFQFGAPKIQDQVDTRKLTTNTPLKVLFVGRLDQRKGIGYLLKAMEHFDPLEVEFHVIGAKPNRFDLLSPYWSRIHDHGTLPQNKVWEVMRSCDLFILPTLFEGQALVVLEAMSCGLPVLVTPNAGVDQVLQEGVNGFEIPIRSTDAIVEKINWMKLNPENRKEMGNAALNRSRDFTWESYQAEIIKSAMELIG